jgi:hypothetical protein
VPRWTSNATLEELGEFVPQPLKPALRRTRDLALGTWPASLAEWRLARTPVDPSTFNDKVRYRIAYDRRPHLTTFADKVAVRDYVADRVGLRYLTPQYGVHRSADDVDWTSLPREYVIKASHGSGAVVLVTDQADSDARLPTHTRWAGWDRFAVRPEHAPRALLAPLVDKWMTLNYEFGPGRLPEWAYRDVPPRIITEQLLVGPAGEKPVDIKFFVFDGVCEFLYVGTGDDDGYHRNLFTPCGTPIPVEYGYSRAAVEPRLPSALAEFVEVAEELGRGVDFVRVDLYDVAGRLVFGELTNYPSAGVDEFRPATFDEALGARWNLVR